MIERACLLSTTGVLRLEGVLAESTMPRAPEAPAPELPPTRVVIPEIEWRRRERENLRTAMELAGGRVYGPGGAAELLGIAPTTLISRLKAVGLRDSGKRPAARTEPRPR